MKAVEYFIVDRWVAGLMDGCKNCPLRVMNARVDAWKYR
jgi:hypothetical protein